MLRVARKLGKERNVRVKTTFLGAHAIPPEFTSNADAYIDYVCKRFCLLVHADSLADAVDGFCENIAFSTKQISRVFDKARALGLPCQTPCGTAIKSRRSRACCKVWSLVRRSFGIS